MRYENKSSLFGYFCFEIALSKNPEIAAISFQRTIVRLCGGPATGATAIDMRHLLKLLKLVISENHGE